MVILRKCCPRTTTSEGGRSGSSYNPASRSSNWGNGSSWNPSSSIVRPSYSLGRCPSGTKCITYTKKTTKKYQRYGSTEDGLWGQRWTHCLLPSWMLSDHDSRIGHKCESEGASTKQVFSYDVKYQWNNQELATIIMRVSISFQSRLQKWSRFLNVMETMNGEHGEKYWGAMGIEM